MATVLMGFFHLLLWLQERKRATTLPTRSHSFTFALPKYKRYSLVRICPAIQICFLTATNNFHQFIYNINVHLFFFLYLVSLLSFPHLSPLLTFNYNSMLIPISGCVLVKLSPCLSEMIKINTYFRTRTKDFAM